MKVLEVNGWKVLFHPEFRQQLDALKAATIDAKIKHPSSYEGSTPVKLLATITHLFSVVIPTDPANPAFNQGKTLGDGASHWKRAKFNQQFRMFFRYDARSKIIVIAWVNDENTKRAYGSKTDAYKVFRKMLESGHPPNNWDQLLKEALSDPDPVDKSSKPKKKS